MSKINISVPDGILDEIDRRAESAGTTRSGFLRDAAAHYMGALDEQTAAKERSKRMLSALDKMRSLASSVGAPDAATMIRELRDTAPRWEKP